MLTMHFSKHKNYKFYDNSLTKPMFLYLKVLYHTLGYCSVFY